MPMHRFVVALFSLLLLFGSAHGSSYIVDDSDDDYIDFPFDSAPEVDITVTFGGDVVLGTRESWWQRDDAFPAVIEKNGAAYPFQHLLSLFRQDDLTMVNLECVLKESRTGEMTNKQFRFRGLPSYTDILTQSSIELVNIANNHYIDYGNGGRSATRAALEAAGIPYSGYEYTYVFEHQGIRIGFAGCRETVWKVRPEVVSQDIKQLREDGCQLLIYSCHWGTEYEAMHNDTQLEMAQYVADCGADLIVGTHPHVVQGISIVGDTPVIWSLGNLMFGGTIEMTTFDAVLARATFSFKGQNYMGCSLQMIPVLTSGSSASGTNDYSPVLAEGYDKARILLKIQQDSALTITDDPISFSAK